MQRASLFLFAGWLLPACGTEVPSELGAATAELTTVPAGVSCLHVHVTGDREHKRNFSLSAGQSSAQLDLGAVPLGPVIARASAYASACPSSSNPPSTAPTWVADDLTAVVVSGVPAKFNFVLHPVTPGHAGADFEIPAVDIAAAGATTYALLVDGTVWSWGGGNDIHGSLGDGTTIPFRATPAKIPTLANVTQIAAGTGHHACALLVDGTVRCWGRNDMGQLGDGSIVNRNVPVPVVGLSGVVKITAGETHSCAIVADGTAFCWGSNASGQFGNGTNTSSLTPTAVNPSLGNYPWVDVAAGAYATCLVNTIGSVFCSGHNVGDGTTIAKTVPTPVRTSNDQYGYLKGVTDLAAGSSTLCGRRADGRVLCWGSLYHQAAQPYATSIAGLTDAVSMGDGSWVNCAVIADGHVRCFGDGYAGQLGDGAGTNVYSGSVPVKGIDNAVKVDSGNIHSCALLDTGAIRCWGGNVFGMLGNGTLHASFTPTPVVFPN